MVRESDMTPEEWRGVQETLLRGGLQAYINNLLANRAHSDRPRGVSVVNSTNLKIIEQAFDDGDGGQIEIVSTDEPQWFEVTYEKSQVMLGMQRRGVLYAIVHLSGGAKVQVLVGRDLLNNVVGTIFDTVAEAKAYVKGLTAK